MAELDSKNTLDAVIASLKIQLSVLGIEKSGSGLEFCIFKAVTSSGDIAIKVPRDRIFSNVNDNYIDSQTLLDQEFAIMQHLQSSGVAQAPKPIQKLDAAGFGALVMTYIPSDNTKPSEQSMGLLLAKIHAINPPKLSLSAQEGMTIPDLIANRLHRRWTELAKFVPSLPALPNVTSLRADLAEAKGHERLLHMDYREANLRTNCGDITAVVDWSNALIGHPALELARAAETGETGEAFLRAYYSLATAQSVSARVETIFRLDTATMLALVFLSEEPNPVRAPLAIARVLELCGNL